MGIGTSSKPEEDRKKSKVVIVGAGAFGTAMAYVASWNAETVVIVARDPEQVAAINETGKNPKHPCTFPSTNVTATTEMEEATKGGVDFIILALPAQKTPDWLIKNKEHIPDKTLLCSTAKGLYLETKDLLSVTYQEILADKHIRFAVLSGPSFAVQIVENHPTAVVVASTHLADAVAVQRAMSTSRFRVYASQDVVGVELGGALKNVLAIGAGMITGKEYGINTMAAYLTRACRELSCLCVAMGGHADTVSGLSGIGDLMLTAFGELSRNRTCGVRLAKGEPLADILDGPNKLTVEGVPTAAVAVEFAAKSNLDLPIFASIHAILQGELSCDEALVRHMARPVGMERPLH